MTQPAWREETLDLRRLRVDGKTQARDGISEERVKEYAELYREEVDLGLLCAVFDGAAYWLSDGFHRREAAMRAGLSTVRVRVTFGTLADARWIAAGANAAHGLPLSREDRRRAAEMALRARPETSDRAVATHCGLDHKTVGKIRKSMEDLPQVDGRVGVNGVAQRIPDRESEPEPSEESIAEPEVDYPDEEPGEESQESEEDTEVVGLPRHRDEAGAVIPAGLQEIWRRYRERSRQVQGYCKSLAEQVHELAATPCGEAFAASLEHRQSGKEDESSVVRNVSADLRALQAKISRTQPYASFCVVCVLESRERSSLSCRSCRGRGFITKEQWDFYSEQEQATALADVEQM